MHCSYFRLFCLSSFPFNVFFLYFYFLTTWIAYFCIWGFHGAQLNYLSTLLVYNRLAGNKEHSSASRLHGDAGGWVLLCSLSLVEKRYTVKPPSSPFSPFSPSFPSSPSRDMLAAVLCTGVIYVKAYRKRDCNLILIWFWIQQQSFSRKDGWNVGKLWVAKREMCKSSCIQDDVTGYAHNIEMGMPVSFCTLPYKLPSLLVIYGFSNSLSIVKTLLVWSK